MNEEAIWQAYLPAGFTARPSTLADAAAATDLFNAAAIKYPANPLLGWIKPLIFGNRRALIWRKTAV